MDFEIKIIEFLQSGKSPFFDISFQVISQLGAICGVIFLCLFLLFFQRKLCFWFLFSYGFAGLTTRILKGLVRRPRPFIVSETITTIGDAVTDFSFPSGHATCATAIAIFLCYFLFKKYKSKLARFLIVLSGVVYVGLVCLSRMYLGKHYLTDLLVGVVISAIVCTLGILFMKYYNKKKEIYKGENKNGNQ